MCEFRKNSCAARRGGPDVGLITDRKFLGNVVGDGVVKRHEFIEGRGQSKFIQPARLGALTLQRQVAVRAQAEIGDTEQHREAAPAPRAVILRLSRREFAFARRADETERHRHLPVDSQHSGRAAPSPCGGLSALRPKCGGGVSPTTAEEAGWRRHAPRLFDP